MPRQNTNPVYLAEHKGWQARISTANTNLDGTGTLVTIVSCTNDAGLSIETVRAKALGTTTAGMVRLFIDDGSEIDLLEEIPVSAITPDATTESFQSTVTLSVDLANGESLKASTENAETFAIRANGGEY